MSASIIRIFLRKKKAIVDWTNKPFADIIIDLIIKYGMSKTTATNIIDQASVLYQTKQNSKLNSFHHLKFSIELKKIYYQNI